MFKHAYIILNEDTQKWLKDLLYARINICNLVERSLDAVMVVGSLIFAFMYIYDLSCNELVCKDWTLALLFLVIALIVYTRSTGKLESSIIQYNILLSDLDKNLSRDVFERSICALREHGPNMIEPMYLLIRGLINYSKIEDGKYYLYHKIAFGLHSRFTFELPLGVRDAGNNDIFVFYCGYAGFSNIDNVVLKAGASCFKINLDSNGGTSKCTFIESSDKDRELGIL